MKFGLEFLHMGWEALASPPILRRKICPHSWATVYSSHILRSSCESIRPVPRQARPAGVLGIDRMLGDTSFLIYRISDVEALLA
jgi:hypothetical protein